MCSLPTAQVVFDCIEKRYPEIASLQSLLTCWCFVCFLPTAQVVFDFIEKRYPEIVSFNVEGAKVLPPAVVQEVRRRFPALVTYHALGRAVRDHLWEIRCCPRRWFKGPAECWLLQQELCAGW